MAPHDVKTDAYERVTVGRYSDGTDMVVNKRTSAMLQEAEKRLGYLLTIYKGSYRSSGGSDPSAGTHDGGGAVDLAPFDADRKVSVLRDIGFAAWHRPEIPGLWGEHVHAIAYGDMEMSAAAKAQIVDYRNHRDGLASHAADPVPRPEPIPLFNYARWLHILDGDDHPHVGATDDDSNKTPGTPFGAPLAPHKHAIEEAAEQGLAHAKSDELKDFFKTILHDVRKQS